MTWLYKISSNATGRIFDIESCISQIVNYLDRDWSCTTEIPSNPGEFAVWVFNSYDSVSKMTLELGVKFDMSAGNMQLIVYCPYWMINKTGLMLSYRVSVRRERIRFLFV